MTHLLVIQPIEPLVVPRQCNKIQHHHRTEHEAKPHQCHRNISNMRSREALTTRLDQRPRRRGCDMLP